MELVFPLLCNNYYKVVIDALCYVNLAYAIMINANNDTHTCSADAHNDNANNGGCIVQNSHTILSRYPLFLVNPDFIFFLFKISLLSF